MNIRSADVAVIGAGPAGCAAAVQCTRLGLECTVADSLGVAGGLIREARLVENYPGLLEPLSGMVFAERLNRFLKANRLKVRKFKAGSFRLIPSGFAIEGTDEILTALAVIAATGTVPVSFGFEVGGNAVIHRSILEIDKRGIDSAVVIGGGESALDYALNLACSGCSVKLLVRGSKLRACGKLQEMVATFDSVEILYNTSLLKAEMAEDRTLVTCLARGKSFEFETDAVMASVGRKPCLPDLPDGLKHEAGHVSTSIPGFYIAGDASMGSLGQAAAAAGQGVLAAKITHEYLLKRRGGN